MAATLNLVNTFKLYGPRLVGVKESWTEAPRPVGDLLYSVTAWVAQYESERRSERIKTGLARRVREGLKLGRPRGRGTRGSGLGRATF